MLAPVVVRAGELLAVVFAAALPGEPGISRLKLPLSGSRPGDRG